MNGRIDAERILDAFLAPEADRLPDRVIDAALADIARTPQRRALRVPWRFTLMPTYMRLAAGIAVVAIAGVAALTLLNRVPGFGGPGPSPTPSLVPTPSPAPTQSVVELGTITLTDDGCTWTGNPGSIDAALEPVVGRLAFDNQTDTFGNFGVYRLIDGHTWAEAEAWYLADQEAVRTGASPPPVDFATDLGFSIDAPSRGQYPQNLPLGTGTHGIVCSSNEPPPGEVFAIYLVGPLEIRIP